MSRFARLRARVCLRAVLKNKNQAHGCRMRIRGESLPHFLQNLRYIQSPTDVAKLQTSLNLFLARALHVYGDHTALLADTGVPPLTLIQYTHLAQLHFRLTKTRPDTLPATLFKTFNM